MKRKAFTLIEILIYFIIFAVFLFTAVYFAIQILHVSQVTTNRHELEQSGQFMTDQITTAIQMAESVDSAASSFDTDLGVLSLVMTDSSISPRVFRAASGDFTLTEGGGQAVTLNSPFVQVDSVRFHLISADKTPDQITVDISLSSLSDIPNTQAALSLHFTISLRP